MDSELRLLGSIVDSWVEPSGPATRCKRLVLQVLPRGAKAKDLMIVEAASSLVPDVGWLQDLGENLCHGSPVAAIGTLTHAGLLAAREIQLAR